MLQENGEVPVGILPIGDDPGGNLICMCINRENYGKIYFCDHELEDPETGFIIMSDIAKSFSAFIASCHEMV
jgi:hypothetical protein